LMNGTAWDVEEARFLRSNGWTLKKLAERYDVTWTAVRAAFKRRGVSTADRRIRAVGWNIDIAVQMLADGASSYDVAKAMGVSAVAIRQALKRRGLWNRRVGPVSKRGGLRHASI